MFKNHPQELGLLPTPDLFNITGDGAKRLLLRAAPEDRVEAIHQNDLSRNGVVSVVLARWHRPFQKNGCLKQLTIAQSDGCMWEL